MSTTADHLHSPFDLNLAPDSQPVRTDSELIIQSNTTCSAGSTPWTAASLCDEHPTPILDKLATITNDALMAKQRTVKVSDQLRRIIEDCGLSKYEISKRTNIDEATLSRFMHGERGLSMKALDRLGEYLSLTVIMRRKPRQK